MAMREVVQLIRRIGLASRSPHVTDDLIRDRLHTRALDAHDRRRGRQHPRASGHGHRQRLDRRGRTRLGRDLDLQGNAVQIAGPTRVRYLGFGRDIVGDHDDIAAPVQQVCRAPVHLDDRAFRVVDHDPVARQVRLRRVDHQAREQIAQRALHGQADDDRQRA